ncbi:MAG: SDR family NAD(P)-dependent oxidoreductase [Planctomycetota bacterium]
MSWKVLVTGGAGFIGSHLCERLLREGHEVVNLDNFDPFYDRAIKEQNLAAFADHPKHRFIEGDLCDAEAMQALFERENFDHIVHLAARAGVRPSIEQPLTYENVNVHGTTVLLEACRVSGTKSFLFASSSSVYGNNEKVPFSEDDNVDFPISPYAATKKACELIAYTYHHLFGLDVTGLRFFTVYGPRQRPEMAIHKFTRLIAAGEEVPMFGDGTTRRDYTYIDDIIDGVMATIEHNKGYEVYNLGESETTELRELIRLIGEHLGVEPKIRRLELQPGDVRTTFADVTKAKQKLGYAPSVPVSEGIRRFVDWYRAAR